MTEREIEISKKIIELVKFGFQILIFETDTKVQGMKIETPKEMESTNISYNRWYSASLPIIKQIAPDRLEDFISFYKNSKPRKVITYENYTISDYLVNMTIPRYTNPELVSKNAFSSKFNQQISILNSITERIGSVLSDIKGILQAEMFDSELDSAKHLHKKMFYRASGMIAGVVLEKHLNNVCVRHQLTLPKNPTISNYNELLKNNEIINLPIWRNLTLLGDLRNLCSHGKDKEPTRDECLDLIEGVEKIIKKVY